MGEDLHDSGLYCKKSKWSAEEDEILRAYVEEHGDKNWSMVAENIGLSRNGKSCRFRWVNHLKPTLKKGAFTKKEEEDIVRLHARYGNQWARMATEIVGRTDNEIKNYWNTRVKRLKRDGLPIYPPEVQVQVAAAHTGQNTFSIEGEILCQQDMNMYYNKRLREMEAASPFMGSYATNVQSDQLGKNTFLGTTSNSFSFPPCSPFIGDAYASTSRLPSHQSCNYQEESGYWRPKHSNPAPSLELQGNHELSNCGIQQYLTVSGIQFPLEDQTTSELMSTLEFPLKPFDKEFPLHHIEDAPVDTNTIGHDFSTLTDFDLDGISKYGSTSRPLIRENENFKLPSHQSCDYQQYLTVSGIQFPLEDQTTSEFMSTLDDQLLKPFDKEFPLHHIEDTPVDTNTIGHDFSALTDFDLDEMAK